MSTVLCAHFQSIDVGIFRKKSLKKGQKLVHSFHVSDVREERRDDTTILISGTVLRETSGAQSKRKHENLYCPIAHVNKKRKVTDTVCSCKAGNGYCKHAAAICVFVNEENIRSKTDSPMLWNRPPEIQLEKYSKGCTIAEMRRIGDNDSVPLHQVFKFQEVQYTDELRSENCSLSVMINAELGWLEAAQDKKILRLETERQVKELISELFEFIIQDTSTEYRALESVVDKKTMRVKVSVMLCPQGFSSFYQKKITVDENSWKEICFLSVNQSETAVWFQERRLRITASTKAHRIKTRQADFDSLSRQFIKTKYNGTLTEPMRYGITTEPEAKQKFCEITGHEVHDVGLVIRPAQPFLACSPDGVIRGPDGFQLLEIKCPYTCKDTKITGVVYGTKISFVDYLFYNKREELELNPKHQYYTQVQLSLYVTGMKTCYFFVYSPRGHALVMVKRDEKFFAENIPKFENFYFKHFLPMLSSLP